MKITTILPVSRIKYLDRVLESLLAQTVKIKSLIVIFDGPESEFVQVRNRIAELDIENKLCVPFPHVRPAYTIAERRWRIVRIHTQLQEVISDCDWVFSVEDDGILPPNALADLINVTKSHKDVGMVTGVELGRWGLPYVGAWRLDDVHSPSEMTSMENKAGEPLTETIDACGLYCALIRSDMYKEHIFDTSNGLGPDVNLGLFCRQNGYQNYVRWSVPVTHLGNHMNQEIEIPATDKSKVIKLTRKYGTTWKQ